MRMVVLGVRNLLRNKLRLAVVALLIAFPFCLLLAFQAISAAVRGYAGALKRGVDTSLQLRAKCSMSHVNMVGSSRLLPHEALEKARGIERVAKVEPYLLGMSPTEGHNFAMHVGLTVGDAKRLGLAKQNLVRALQGSVGWITRASGVVLILAGLYLGYYYVRAGM